jgi:serine/threonine protein kinase
MLKKTEILALSQVEHILNEKTILERTNHPFIVRMGGSFQGDFFLLFVAGQVLYSWLIFVNCADAKHVFIALEFVIGGEFFTHLRRAGRFKPDNARFYAAQIVLMFEYLHSCDIIYRDLKPENLLLDETGYLKLADFGFAKYVQFKTYTLCGTPEYLAPEVILNKGHGRGVDWWTLGILLFEMISGQPPFIDADPLGIYRLVLAGNITFSW